MVSLLAYKTHSRNPLLMVSLLAYKTHSRNPLLRVSLLAYKTHRRKPLLFLEESGRLNNSTFIMAWALFPCTLPASRPAHYFHLLYLIMAQALFSMYSTFIMACARSAVCSARFFSSCSMCRVSVFSLSNSTCDFLQEGDICWHHHSTTTTSLQACQHSKHTYLELASSACRLSNRDLNQSWVPYKLDDTCKMNTTLIIVYLLVCHEFHLQGFISMASISTCRDSLVASRSLSSVCCLSFSSSCSLFLDSLQVKRNQVLH